MPYVRSDLGDAGSSATYSTDRLQASLGNTSGRHEGLFGFVSIWDIILSVGSMFFWTFGALPVWLDAIFLVPRLVLVFIVARNIWVGGGG